MNVILAIGHPEYGCFISKEKSLLNFDHPTLANIVDPRSQGMKGCSVPRLPQSWCNKVRVAVFPWCGYLINMADLSVTVDYSRFHQTCK